MIYPLLTLYDDTEYTYTDLQSDGTVIVYVETPNAIDGFHSLECVLPSFQIRNVQGYSVQKQKEILDTIKAHAAKIQVVFDKEDKHDAVIAEQAYNEYLKDGKKSRPITELWSELDI